MSRPGLMQAPPMQPPLIQAPARAGAWLRMAVASAWSGMLVLAGLVALLDFADRVEGAAWAGGGRARALCMGAGATLVLMGQFVFAALVADRLFPRASPLLRIGFQGLTGAAFVAGLVVLALLLAGVLA